MKPVRTILTAAALAFIAAWSPDASAQSSGTAQQAADFSDQEIKAFATASLEVTSISQAYTPKIQAATTEEKRQALRKEASQKMLSAVRDKGLTAEEYNRIARAAQQDADLARQIEELRGAR